MEAMNRVNLVGWLTKEVQYGKRWDGQPWGRISMMTEPHIPYKRKRHIMVFTCVNLSTLFMN